MLVYKLLTIFFFKQKTAYEMRISDWSSDVCSSDLLVDYTCATTADYLERALVDPEMLSFDYMRANLIEGDGPNAVPVSFNEMMARKFALKALETIYRIIARLNDQTIRWDDMLVLIFGREERHSARLTWKKKSNCQVRKKIESEKKEERQA